MCCVSSFYLAKPREMLPNHCESIRPPNIYYTTAGGLGGSHGRGEGACWGGNVTRGDFYTCVSTGKQAVETLPTITCSITSPPITMGGGEQRNQTRYLEGGFVKTGNGNNWLLNLRKLLVSF